MQGLFADTMKTMRQWAAAFFLAWIMIAAAHAQAPKPNIVMILVDDAAFMDFGAYGGEARTPNIDALASQGAMFTSFHASPLCSPSRAMLLTGIDNHKTGVATIEEVLPPEHRGKPGYSLKLEPGVLTIAQRLKASGYRTYMTGKWHLGREPKDLPNQHGFDRTFILDASGADNWEQKSYMPYYDHAPWFEDGKQATLPDEFYSSKFLVDQMMAYVDSGKASGQPFLAYIAFQALHIPVQAPADFTAHYKGQFDQGWDALREARWQRAKDRGLIPRDAPLAPMPDNARKWDSLSADQKRIAAKSMEVYSGMLEAMDHHIGRLVQHLKDQGQYANTIFVITSDNGPEPTDPVHASGMNIWMALNGYHWREHDLGEKGSLGFVGREWAAALASPGQMYKFFTTEGGIRVPFIVAGPGIPAGGRHTAPAFLTDIVPTLLELTGTPVAETAGTVPITGQSMVPVLSGTAARVHAEDRPIGVEVAGNAALFKGDFKIMRNVTARGDTDWQLFNIAIDPGETNDLSAAMPGLKQQMLADYATYMKTMGVLEMPPGYQVQRQVVTNVLMKQLGYYWWVLAILAVAVLGLIYSLWRFVLSPLWRRRV